MFYIGYVLCHKISHIVLAVKHQGDDRIVRQKTNVWLERHLLKRVY